VVLSESGFQNILPDCGEMRRGFERREEGHGRREDEGLGLGPIGALQFNITHDYEHYGNLITYLRMKGLVPPSSERRQ